MIVGYARISVNDRVGSHSIENQKKIIALWVEQNELPISKFYVDTGYSGSTFPTSGIFSRLKHPSL